MEGVLLLDKPSGITSAKAVEKVKKKLRAKKAGHTGTLDPLATGLLVVLLGKATRFAPFLQKLPKTYLFTVAFGEERDTWDAEGTTTFTSDEPLSCERLSSLLPSLTGRQLQEPPPYSAKKVKGKRAYRLAREGKEVKLKPVEVEVKRLELLSCDEKARKARLLTELSSGGYVRSLAHRLGRELGLGAFVEELRRTAVGPLKVEEAVPLEEFLSSEEPEKFLLPVWEVLSFMPAVELSREEALRLLLGAPLKKDLPFGGEVRLFSGGRFLGVGVSEEGVLKPKRLLAYRDWQT